MANEITRLQPPLTAAYMRFIALAQQLTPAQRGQPGVCGHWSAQELAAHLIGWDQAMLTLVNDPAHFEPPSDVDVHNARSVAARRQRSWDEVLAELRTTFAELQAALATVPPEAPFYGRLVQWLPGRSADYTLHAAQLADWLQAQTRRYWDEAAAAFDAEPDHGLRDPQVRGAWLNLLTPWLPPAPAAVLDIGCGTGSLSLLLAERGHHVTGIDLSPAMIGQATAKAQAAGQPIAFQVMEASAPQLAGQRFALLLCRHLLWALPQPAQVLERWRQLLQPGGRLLLIEGFWHTGGGLHAQQVVDALPAAMSDVVVQSLSEQPALWGGPVSDERFLVTAIAKGDSR